MITLIVPTLNRAAILAVVIDSFYSQDKITEVIFVNDGGSDNTQQVIHDCAAKYPLIKTKYIINASRVGAAQSRNIGVAHAVNDYILFCDDDMYLGDDYASVCLQKMQKLDASAISGRLIYMREGETKDTARARFGHGMRHGMNFWPLICMSRNSAVFIGDLEVPLTHAVILTKKALVELYPFDSFYGRGNGFREESDYQMNLFVQGHHIFTTNDCATLHLPMSQVQSGGQRVGHLQGLYWSVFYTNYFFGKYYAAYAKRLAIRAPQWVALTAFALYATYKELVRPTLYALYLFLLSAKQQRGGDAAQNMPKK